MPSPSPAAPRRDDPPSGDPHLHAAPAAAPRRRDDPPSGDPHLRALPPPPTQDAADDPLSGDARIRARPRRPTQDAPGALPVADARIRAIVPTPAQAAEDARPNAAPTDTPAPTGLARRLREGTADVHRAAERMAMIQALLRGVADRRAYGALLRAYHAIYGALEAALLRHRGDPAIAAITVPALFRQPALTADLAVVLGPAAPAALASPPSPATRAYVERIEAIAAARPRLLVAHAYVRSFGDLAGGRILGRIVGRALGLTEGAGLDFHAFPGIDDPAALLAELRGRLDALALADGEAEALIDEARRAFACNIAVFAELEGSALRGLARLLRGRPRAPAPA